MKTFKKIKDILIYQKRDFYSAFPSIANLGNGKIIVAFRRAPNYHGLPGISKDYCKHADVLSQYMSVFSEDNGGSWSDAKLIYSPPEGASQDGGLFFDGKYLFAHSFMWKYIPNIVADEMKRLGADEFLQDFPTYAVPVGSYVMRSEDKGKTWDGPFIPDPLPGGKEVLPGKPLRIHNRGNIIRFPDGDFFMTGQMLGFRPEFYSSAVLYKSNDNGLTWNYFSTPAASEGVAIFEEPCLHITPSGKFVMLIRCHRDGEQRFEKALLFISESYDKGKTWSSPCNTGIHAEPSTAFKMNDGRALIGYGYRKDPFGVRMRICNPELDNIESAEEIIIRDDVGFQDTGYPWITQIEDNRFLIIYYVNKPSYEGAASIEGTIFEI